MKVSRRLRFVPAVLFTALIFALQACGGGGTTADGTSGGTSTTGSSGGTTSGTTGGTTGTSVADAISSLNALIRGSSAANAADLDVVRTKFIAAQTAEPANADARTGRAIVEASIAARKLLDLYGSNLTGDDIINLTSPMLETSTELTLEAIAGGRFLPRTSLIDKSKLIGLMPFLGQTDRLSDDDPTPWQIAAALNDALTYLNAAISELTVFTQDTPATVIADATPDGSETGATATASFGWVERRALLAHVSAYASMVNLITAYHYELNGFNPNQLATTAYQTQFNNEDTLGPASYVPGGNFLTLRADGPTRLNRVRDLWTAATNAGIAALDAYLTRAVGDHIIADGSTSMSLASGARSDIDQARTFFVAEQLSTDVPLADGVTNIAINYAALIDSPPQDLRVYFPKLILSVVDGAYAVDVDGESNIDLTIGGIFPEGLSDLAFYLRGLFGITETDTGDIVVFGLNIFG